MYKFLLKYYNLILIIAVVVMLAISTFVFIMAIYKPLKEYKLETNIEEKNNKTEEFTTIDDADSLHSRIEEITKKEMTEAYLKSRLKISEYDSVNLSINLLDSTINLEIKGVSVQTTKIVDIQKSNILAIQKYQDLKKWISTPFELQDYYSMIEKQHIIEKIAPKDSSEYKANVPKVEKDTTDVHVILRFDKDLIVELKQTEPLFAKDFKSRLNFDHYNDIITIKQAFQAVTHFKKAEYHPKLILKISKVDAKAIFRAIPHNAKMALML